jgi:transcriptional regulator with XRE-family HTH domain
MHGVCGGVKYRRRFADMENSQPATSVTLGPSGPTFRETVRRVRQQRGWTLKELSAALAPNAHPISQSALSKIENGTRRVDVDDAIALSAALGVPPNALLMPSTSDPRATVQLTGWGEERAFEVWRWAIEAVPLAGDGKEAESPGLPWWLEVSSRFALANLLPSSSPPRKGQITRTVKFTLEEDDPRIPFIVSGETLADSYQETPAGQKLQYGDMAGVNQAALERALRDAQSERASREEDDEHGEHQAEG